MNRPKKWHMQVGPPVYNTEEVDLYMDAIAAENARLRGLIADWASRLQWTDGLDTCVEEMRKEIKQ